MINDKVRQTMQKKGLIRTQNVPVGIETKTGRSME
jgi:hypothetical protein